MTSKKHNESSKPESGAPSGETQRWEAECGICQAVIMGQEAFRKHVNSHPRCGKCGKRFANSDQMGGHAIVCKGTGEY